MFTPQAHHDRDHDPQRSLTILGLVEIAIRELWDKEIDIKFLLRDAENCRKGGHANLSAGDLEREFIFLARAAMLALEKIPAHRDFATYLSSSQRHNLKLHGKELLFYLEELRLVLVERYRAWSNAQKQNSSTQAKIPALASRQDGRADKTKQADQGDVVGGVHDLPSWAQLSPEDVLTRRQSLRTNRDTQATRGHSSPDDHGRRRGEGPRLGHEVLADAAQLSTISSSGPLPQYFTPRPLGRAKARRVRNPPSIFTDPQEPPQGEPDAPLEVLSPLVFSPSIIPDVTLGEGAVEATDLPELHATRHGLKRAPPPNETGHLKVATPTSQGPLTSEGNKPVKPSCPPLLGPSPRKVNLRDASPAPAVISQSRTADQRMTPLQYAELDVPSPMKPHEKIRALVARLSVVFDDVQQYRQLLSSRDFQAQRLLDAFQILLDTLCLNGKFRRNLVVATQRLSRTAGLYPTCYSLGDVELVGDHPVAAGGFADIHRGRFLGHAVCLKVIRVYQTSHIHSFLKQFSAEAILWGQLSHPNVLPIYGLYRYGSRPCLVSPWMENGDLNSFLSRYPQTNRILLVSDVASGVDYLHTNDIIHGDLKGANILVSSSWRAVLADFGLSSVSDTNILHWTSHSSVGSKGGSIRWQAPELFDIDNDDIVDNSKASDVYAFSCVCYEIFTGNIPFFEVPRDSAVMSKVKAGARPSRPPVLSPAWASWGLTDIIWALMRACWNTDPNQRPTIQSIVTQHASKVTVDDRQSERRNFLAPAHFRDSVVRGADLLSVHKLEAFLGKSGRVPDATAQFASLSAYALRWHQCYWLTPAY